jgi:hypothetical protein
MQGPPGTGKTYTAAEQVLELIAHGRKVGITAPSLAVIHHLIDKVYEHDLHRLNVATSRAQALAIIVASPDLIRVSCRTPQ